MRWKVRAFSWNDPTTTREIRAATTRKLTLRKNAPSTFECSMQGDHKQAKLLTELVTDVIVSANGTDLIRARLGNTQDTVAESGYGVTFQFIDYRGVLLRRALKAADTHSYPNTDQSDIAWKMLVEIQARTNGNYGITRGVGTSTGIKRDWNPKAGEFVGKIITDMSNMDDGYDWDISPAMVFNLYFPARGTTAGVGIEYGKTMSSFTRTKTPSSFANDDIVAGGGGLQQVEVASATIATDPQGRWDGVYSYSTITLPESLDARAQFNITQTAKITPGYTVNLAPGFWRGPAHIGLGDIITVKAKRGRINEILTMQVLEIPITILDDGSEQVQLGLVGV